MYKHCLGIQVICISAGMHYRLQVRTVLIYYLLRSDVLLECVSTIFELVCIIQIVLTYNSSIIFQLVS